MKDYHIELNFTHKPIEIFNVQSDNNTHAILDVLNNLGIDDKENVITVTVTHIQP